MKDYYKILELSPTATYADIKKSYRRLALQYHPDRNFGSQLYEAKFKEIKEAYEILSDANHRQTYNANYNTKTAETPKKKTTTNQNQVTPDHILNQIIDFRKKIAALDPDRTNKLALFQNIEKLLSHKHIVILKQNNDLKLNKKIINEILYCSRFLPYVFVERICYQLSSLASADNALHDRIYTFSKKVRMREYWHRFKFLAAIVLAIILCLIIYIVCTTL